MNPQIATVVYLAGILGLFLLDPERKPKTSKALWLPVVWLWINGSRPLSAWLEMKPPSAVDLDGSPLDRTLYALLMVGAVIVLVKRRPSVIRTLRANPAVLLFVLYCGYSVLWSDDPAVAFKRWTKSLGDFMMVLIVLTDPQRIRAVKRLLTRVSFMLIPLSVLLIKYYPYLSRAYGPWDGRMFVSGVATDKNMLGMICLFFGLGTVWQLLEDWRDERGTERTRRLIAYGAVLAMLSWLFVLADSKTSVSCFVMAAGLLALTHWVRSTRKTAVIHLAVAAIVGISFAVLFLDVGGSVLETLGRNRTLTGRTEIWAGLLKTAGSSLFGSGFESFWLPEHLSRIWRINEFLRGVNEAHNGYLEVYLNLGWVGIILLAALMFTGYRHAVAGLRRDVGIGNLGLALFVAATVFAFTEAAFRIMSPIWFGFLLSIMTVPKPRAHRLPTPPILNESPLDTYAFTISQGVAQ